MLSSINPVASQSQLQPAVATATQSSAPVKAAIVPAKTAQPAPQPVTSSADTVSISTAAQAALKESIETPAQTAKEAGNGDRQAQRLLAKEVAANHIS